MRECLTSMLLLVALLTTACNRSPVESNCTPALDEMQTKPDANWRATVLEKIDTLPDSAWREAAVFGVVLADSVIFVQYGGRITYEFQGFRASLVRMQVSGYRELALDSNSDPQKKIASVQISGVPAVLYSCS